MQALRRCPKKAATNKHTRFDSRLCNRSGKNQISGAALRNIKPPKKVHDNNITVERKIDKYIYEMLESECDILVELIHINSRIKRYQSEKGIIMHQLKNFVADESGAAAVEYGMLVALIAAVVIGAVVTLGADIKLAFDGIVKVLTANKVP